MQAYNSLFNIWNFRILRNETKFAICSSKPMLHSLKYIESLNLTSKDLQNLTLMLSKNSFALLNDKSYKDILTSFDLELSKLINNYKTLSVPKHCDSGIISPKFSKQFSGVNLTSIRQFHTRNKKQIDSTISQYIPNFKEDNSSSNLKSRKLSYQKLLITFILVSFITYKLIKYLMSGSNEIKGKMLTSLFKDGYTPIHSDVRFTDVQGCDEVKKELQDVVAFLKNPTVFNDMGAHLPKGVLLAGPPGVGKTLIAKAVAGESGVPFFSCSGSEFDEMFVGLGASRIRRLFSTAREHAPCVIFIDELDAVCGKRASSSLHPYANQSVNQILSEMDGLSNNEGIIVMGSTNREEALDEAVLRPGRFDLKVKVYPPDYLGRISLFELYLGKLHSVDTTSINLEMWARSTIGFTGAHIRNLVNQAAIICVLRGNTAVNQSHLDEAEAKLQLGAVRSKSINEQTNRLCAYHEAGHALVTYFSKLGRNELKRVSILPRGFSGGHTSYTPKDEGNMTNRSDLLTQIDIAFGGRAAEEILNGTENISSGVSSDVKVATKTARYMVEQLTMSSEIGLMVFDDKVSDTFQQKVDEEIIKILDESYKRAKSLIEKHSKEWHDLANYLLKYDTLSGDDVEAIFQGKKPSVELRKEKGKYKNISESMNFLPKKI